MSENNKTEFKKGDEAVIFLDTLGGTYIKQTTIKNVTPKGTIKTDNGYTFTPDGIYTSNEKYSTTFGCIIPYDKKGKNVIAGRNCISDMIKMQKSLLNDLNKMYQKIFNTRQCDLEKLESIKNRLDEIKKELSEMVSNK